MTNAIRHDIVIPESEGVGDPVRHHYLATYTDVYGKVYPTVYQGTVAAPGALAKDNSYRAGATYSDDMGRLIGWVERYLPKLPKQTEPGLWDIAISRGALR